MAKANYFYILSNEPDGDIFIVDASGPTSAREVLIAFLVNDRKWKQADAEEVAHECKIYGREVIR